MGDLGELSTELLPIFHVQKNQFYRTVESETKPSSKKWLSRLQRIHIGHREAFQVCLHGRGERLPMIPYITNGSGRRVWIKSGNQHQTTLEIRMSDARPISLTTSKTHSR